MIELARKHAGTGWYLYDNLFRQQMNAGAKLAWNDINPSLMAATVLSSGRGGAEGRMCTLCMASDHSAPECALSSLETTRQWPQPPTRSPQVPEPRPPSKHGSSPTRKYSEPCRRFNRGGCQSKNCRFDHSCNFCFKGPPHSALECPRKDSAADTSKSA